MPELSAPKNQPARRELSTTDKPPAPKQRTLTVPKSLGEGTRRASMAKTTERLAEKFDALDAGVEKNKAERLEKSRILGSFRPTSANKKDTSTPVEKKPETEKTEPETKIEKTEEKPEAEKSAKVVKEDKTTDKPGREEKTSTPAEERAEVPAQESVKATEEKPSEESHGIPDEHIRSLKAFAMSDADIKEGIKNSPKAFATMARMMHAARQKEIQDFAAIGRARAGQQAGAQIGPSAGQQPTSAASPVQAGLVAKVNADEIAKKFGITDPALIKAIIEPMNLMADQINASHHQKQAHEVALTQGRVDAFFKSAALKSYEEDYKSPEAKSKIVEMTTFILNGATVAGKRLSLEDAMQMAHDATAAPKAKAVARQEIRKEAEERQAGLTLRPSGSVATKSDSRPKTRAELYAKTGLRLKALGS